MKGETRYEMKNRLAKELAALDSDRKELETQRSMVGTEFNEFMDMSSRINAISVRQYTIKFKLHQLANNQPLLGHALPEQSTSDRELQGRGGARTN